MTTITDRSHRAVGLENGAITWDGTLQRQPYGKKSFIHHTHANACSTNAPRTVLFHQQRLYVAAHHRHHGPERAMKDLSQRGVGAKQQCLWRDYWNQFHQPVYIGCNWMGASNYFRG